MFKWKNIQTVSRKTEESIVWLNLIRFGLENHEFFIKLKITKNSSHNGLTNLFSSRASTMDSFYSSIKYNNNMVKDFVADALESENLSQLKSSIFSVNGKCWISQTKPDKN